MSLLKGLPAVAASNKTFTRAYRLNSLLDLRPLLKHDFSLGISDVVQIDVDG